MVKIGNLEVYGVIYKVTNNINGKVYIGQSINGFDKRYPANGEDAERMYNRYLKEKERGRSYNIHLYRAMCKYGFKNFSVNKVFDVAFSQEELDIKEIMYIKIFDCVKNGYNDTYGGRGYIASEELKERLSFIQKEITPKGEDVKFAKHTNEQIINLKKDLANGMSIEMASEQNGVPKKETLRIMRLETWREVGKEYNDIISNISRREYSKTPIIVFDKCMNEIHRYDTVIEASKDMNIPETRIYHCLEERSVVSCDYVFVKNDKELEQSILKKKRLLLENDYGLIALIDKEGNIVKVYNTCVEVNKDLGVDPSSVTKVIKGKANHTKGYVFTKLYCEL